MHSKNYVHRDIKPENLLIGLGKKQNMIHIVDFGLTKRYKDATTGEHMAKKQQQKGVQFWSIRMLFTIYYLTIYYLLFTI